MTTVRFRYSPPPVVLIRKNDLLHGDRIATEFQLWSECLHTSRLYTYILSKMFESELPTEAYISVFESEYASFHSHP
jgi:hypothetical protein